MKVKAIWVKKELFDQLKGECALAKKEEFFKNPFDVDDKSTYTKTIEVPEDIGFTMADLRKAAESAALKGYCLLDISKAADDAKLSPKLDDNLKGDTSE